jgi:hypothetical protein
MVLLSVVGHLSPAAYLAQPIPALDQLHQQAHKAGSRSPIDDIVIKYHRQVKDLARLDPAFYKGWLPGNTPHHQALVTV